MVDPTSPTSSGSHIIHLESVPLIAVILMLQPGLIITISYPKKPSYLTPKNLPSSVKSEYKNRMDWLIKYKRTLATNTRTANLARNIEPLSTLVKLSVEGNKHILKESAYRLLEPSISELNTIGHAILKSIEGQKPILHTSKHLLNKKVDLSLPVNRDRVKAIGSYPVNEFDLVAQHLFVRTNSDWAHLEFAVAHLNYDDKVSLLMEILANMEKGFNYYASIQYQFEVISDFPSLAEISASTYTDDLRIQLPSPLYGYDIDTFTDDAASDMMEQAFDISYKLYSLLQSKKPEYAPLATLFGHKYHSIYKTTSYKVLRMSKAYPSFSVKARGLIDSLMSEVSIRSPIHGEYITEIIKKQAKTHSKNEKNTRKA